MTTSAGQVKAPPIAAASARSRSSLLLLGGLVLAAAVFLWQLPFFARSGFDDFLTNVWYHGYTLIWLLVITILGRTLPLRILAAALFIGVFPSMAISLILGYPLAGLIGTNNPLFKSFLIPVIEESAKAGPILLFFWFLARRGTWQPSMSDGLLLGFLVGAGFALHEDALYRRSFGGGFAFSDLAIIFPTIDDERLIGSGRAFGFYHAQWTALMGLSIGAAFFFRQRFRLWWSAPAVALVVVVLDHGRVNFLGDILQRGNAVSNAMDALMLHGRLPVYLLLAGIVAAVVTEIWVLRTMTRRDYLFKDIRPATLLSWLRSWRGTRSLGELRRIQAAREYIRARRSTHYALWRARRGGIYPERVTRMGLMLFSLGERAGLSLEEPGAEEGAAPSSVPGTA